MVSRPRVSLHVRASRPHAPRLGLWLRPLNRVGRSLGVVPPAPSLHAAPGRTPTALDCLPRLSEHRRTVSERRRLAGNPEALMRFEQQLALPLLVLSLAVIPLLLIPLLVTDLSPGVRTTLEFLDWTIWAVFALEYLVRLYLAPDRRLFFRSNLFDLLIVALPLLRPLG